MAEILKAPKDAVYLYIAGSLPKSDKRYYTFWMDDSELIIYRTDYQFFKTVLTGVLSLPLHDILSMEITSDLSKLDSDLKLSEYTNAFGVFNTDFLRKKNNFFTIKYTSGVEKNNAVYLVFGADYPGDASINMKFLNNLIIRFIETKIKEVTALF